MECHVVERMSWGSRIEASWDGRGFTGALSHARGIGSQRGGQHVPFALKVRHSARVLGGEGFQGFSPVNRPKEELTSVTSAYGWSTTGFRWEAFVVGRETPLGNGREPQVMLRMRFVLCLILLPVANPTDGKVEGTGLKVVGFEG